MVCGVDSWVGGPVNSCPGRQNGCDVFRGWGFLLLFLPPPPPVCLSVCAQECAPTNATIHGVCDCQITRREYQIKWPSQMMVSTSATLGAFTSSGLHGDVALRKPPSLDKTECAESRPRWQTWRLECSNQHVHIRSETRGVNRKPGFRWSHRVRVRACVLPDSRMLSEHQSTGPHPFTAPRTSPSLHL